MAMKKLNQEESQQHNRRLVLNTLYHSGESSRVEIARQTQLTRTTVSEIVAVFLSDGLVVETGQAPSQGGKPATLLQVDEDSRLLAGIDLAERQFCGALVNLRGGIRQRLCLPVEAAEGKGALGLVFDLIDQLLGLAEQPVIGIGVGVPGLMDPTSGTVRQAVNLDWRELPLGAVLRERFQRPIYLANDCQAAALGEYTFGKPPSGEHLVLIKTGRGVGAGIVLNGQLFHGQSAGAGEIGHIQINPEGETCRCGNRGCLETILSTQALVKGAADPIKNLESLMRAYQAGNPQVIALVESAAETLSRPIQHLASILNIQDIRIAGSLCSFGDRVLDRIHSSLQTGILPALAGQTRVEFASLGNDIVVLGAASLVLKNELGVL